MKEAKSILKYLIISSIFHQNFLFSVYYNEIMVQKSGHSFFY